MIEKNLQREEEAPFTSKLENSIKNTVWEYVFLQKVFQITKSTNHIITQRITDLKEYLKEEEEALSNSEFRETNHGMYYRKRKFDFFKEIYPEHPVVKIHNLVNNALKGEFDKIPLPKFNSVYATLYDLLNRCGYSVFGVIR